MAETDYICHAIIAGEMRSLYEFHLEQATAAFMPSITSGTAFTGGYGYDDTGRTNGFGVWHIPPAAVTIRAGYWQRWRGWLPSSQNFFHILSADLSRELLRVWLNENSYSIEILMWDGDSLEVVARSFNLNFMLIGADEWKHIGLYFDTSGEILTLYVNGRVALQATGISIGNTGNLFVGRSFSSGNFVDIDDIYVDYSEGVETNQAPPARRFYPALPNGAGSADDWTPNGAAQNYQCVDESTAPDDDTTYVLADSNALLDMYAFASVSPLPINETPTAALIQAYVALSTGRNDGWGSLRFAFKGTGSADYGNLVPVQYNWPTTNDWAVLTDRMDSVPGGGEWTESEFNGGEFGYESAGLV